MAGSRPNGANRLTQRRWTFGACVFDEANWTLAVEGRRVPVEVKPLELLRELLLRAGNVVSKDELLDRIWPNVTVVEASLPTAVGKLRRALGDDRRADNKIIETVPGIGYRLAGSVKVEESTAAPAPAGPTATPAPAVEGQRERQFAAAFLRDPEDQGRQALLPSLLLFGGGIAILLAATAGVLALSEDVRATQTAAMKAEPGFRQKDVEKAIRTLDIAAVERLIAAGWDPAQRWDKEGTDALGMLLNHCEWDRGHDRRQMLLMARTLLEAGAPIDRRNIFGDTAYSIAKAPRYCGPDHPVTQMLEAICYGGDMGPKDRCLATYELNTEQRRQQGLPPKA